MVPLHAELHHEKNSANIIAMSACTKSGVLVDRYCYAAVYLDDLVRIHAHTRAMQTCKFVTIPAIRHDTMSKKKSTITTVNLDRNIVTCCYILMKTLT